jgi:S1-C subfamily serine protease
MGGHLTTKLLCTMFLAAGVVAAQSAKPAATATLDSSALQPVPGLAAPAAPTVAVTSPQMTIPAIARAADGAVVSIIMLDNDGNPIAQGSGFLISKDGLVLTNYHVIEDGSSAIIKLPGGASYVVDGVLAFDKARDVAVIKAHGQNFRTLTLGNSDRIQVGEDVVAIGSPLSLDSTVSNGIVSGIRTVEEEGGKFLQVTAPISPGSSGGPLFNSSGEVVGITTLYLKGGENLNFAIPINDVKPLLLAKSSKIQSSRNETEPVTLGMSRAQPVPGVIKAPTDDRNAYSSVPTPPPVAQTNPNDRVYFQQLYEAGVLSNVNYVCFDDDAYSGSFVTLFFRSGGQILTDDIYTKGVKVATVDFHRDGSSWLISIPPADTNANTRISRVFHFSIEPATMRYLASAAVTTTVGKGETASISTERSGPWGGVCEKVPSRK